MGTQLNGSLIGKGTHQKGVLKKGGTRGAGELDEKRTQVLDHIQKFG